MIKCVAIDDEPIALSIIREYCNRYGNIDLQCFTSPVAGMECVMSSRPDIVFLDIEMNSHNGIELAKQLPPDTCLIFTTAFSNYAIDGFNVESQSSIPALNVPWRRHANSWRCPTTTL